MEHLDESQFDNLAERLSLSVFKELVLNFAASMPGLLNRLKRAAQDNVDDEVARIAHELRGAAGNFGATRLCTLAQALESSVRHGNGGSHLPLTEEIEHAARAAMASIARRLAILVN